VFPSLECRHNTSTLNMEAVGYIRSVSKSVPGYEASLSSRQHAVQLTDEGAAKLKCT